MFSTLLPSVDEVIWLSGDGKSSISFEKSFRKASSETIVELFSLDLVVVVATIRALKVHGGHLLDNIDELNLEALKEGTKNLERHIENMKKYGLDVVVAVNHFTTDNQEEIDYLLSWCKERNYCW